MPTTAHEKPCHCCGDAGDVPGKSAPTEIVSSSGEVPALPAAERSPRGLIFKGWLLWFLAFFGIYASSSVCPFCGTPGCPVGVGGATVVGGLFAWVWQYGKRAWGKIKSYVFTGSR